MASKRTDPKIYVGRVKVNQELIGFSHYNEKGRQVFNARCNYCKHEYETTLANFTDNRRSGNSCSKCSNIQNKTYARLTASQAQVSIIFSNYKSRSKLKGTTFTLDRERFAELINQDCHYCGASPSNVRLDRVKGKRESDSACLTNGLDRIDSSEGYTEENVVPCCEDCNKAKRNLSYDQFIDLIKRIHSHLKLNNE